MEIEKLTMEQAKALFDSKKGQESWELAKHLIGPPTEYAYQNDFVARLLLCGILGAIWAHKDQKLALEGVASLKEHCVTAYDKAVWTFAKGTCYEVFREYSQATTCYKQAIKTYAGMYGAYFRLASIAYGLGGIDAAEKFCTEGLSQMKQDELYDQTALKEFEVQFMGFLNEIFKKRTKKASSNGKNTAGAVVHEKSLEEIWAMEDEEKLVFALGLYVAEKCRYGDEMSVLSKPERVLYVVQGLEMEVNNGGFAQFFFNSSGDFANEVVSACLKIGATQTAEICRKAVSVFGRRVPADRDKRDDMISDNEEIEEILDECDDAFFACEENLLALSYPYILKNKEAFT